MARPGWPRWFQASVAIFCIALSAGVLYQVLAGTAGRGDPAEAQTAAPAPIDACPPGTATPIATLRAMSLPCLADPDRAVSVTAAHGRPEVINVWASWCVPCREETALLADANRRLGDRVMFLGVDTRDDRSAALRFLIETGATYPHAFDPPGAFALQLGVVGLPYTVFVDSNGRIADRHAGPLTAQRLRAGLSSIGVTLDG